MQLNPPKEASRAVGGRAKAARLKTDADSSRNSAVKGSRGNHHRSRQLCRPLSESGLRLFKKTKLPIVTRLHPGFDALPNLLNLRLIYC